MMATDRGRSWEAEEKGGSHLRPKQASRVKARSHAESGEMDAAKLILDGRSTLYLELAASSIVFHTKATLHELMAHMTRGI
jgi:hypothetical protein